MWYSIEIKPEGRFFRWAGLDAGRKDKDRWGEVNG